MLQPSYFVESESSWLGLSSIHSGHFARRIYSGVFRASLTYHLIIHQDIATRVSMSVSTGHSSAANFLYPLTGFAQLCRAKKALDDSSSLLVNPSLHCARPFDDITLLEPHSDLLLCILNGIGPVANVPPHVLHESRSALRVYSISEHLTYNSEVTTNATRSRVQGVGFT